MVNTISYLGYTGRVEHIEKIILNEGGKYRRDKFGWIINGHSLESMVKPDKIILWAEDQRSVQVDNGMVKYGDIISSIILNSYGIDSGKLPIIGSITTTKYHSNDDAILNMYKIDNVVMEKIKYLVTGNKYFVPYKR